MNQSYGQRLIRDFRKNKSIYFLAIPIVLFYLIFHYKTMYGAIIAFITTVPPRASAAPRLWAWTISSPTSPAPFSGAR